MSEKLKEDTVRILVFEEEPRLNKMNKGSMGDVDIERFIEKKMIKRDLFVSAKIL